MIKDDGERYIQIELENGDIYSGIFINEAEELENKIKGEFITLEEVKKNGEIIYYNEDGSKPFTTIRIKKDKIITYMTYKKPEIE